MKGKSKLVGVKRRGEKNEKGFTLLEYAGGAAVLVGVIYVTFRIFGVGMEGFFNALNDWVGNRTSDIEAAN